MQYLNQKWHSPYLDRITLSVVCAVESITFSSERVSSSENSLWTSTTSPSTVNCRREEISEEYRSIVHFPEYTLETHKFY